MALLHTRTMSAASAHLLQTTRALQVSRLGLLVRASSLCCTAALDEHALVTAEREANGGGGQ